MPTAKKSVSKKSAVPKKTTEAIKETPSEKNSFFEDVWAVARMIPKGRVTSYGAIAGYLGTRLSARMVGWAMNACGGVHPLVPAQRVVNRNGMLSAKHHFGGDNMEKLLKKDGVTVKDDTVQDFEKRFWDPAKELSL